jgi:hypothetical protein
VDAVITPGKRFDMGLGNGKPVTQQLNGGVVGVIVDGRGRPYNMVKDPAERVRRLKAWEKELNLYPE